MRTFAPLGFGFMRPLGVLATNAGKTPMVGSLEYRVSCAHCGYVGQIAIEWLLGHPEFPCPRSCGASIVSPVAELSELIPVSRRSRDALDLSTWEPKKVRRPAADERVGRHRSVRGKIRRGGDHR